MLVQDRAELHHGLRSEGREDEQLLAREPRKERIADQTVAEVRGQQAERPAKLLQAEALAQGDPPGPQSPVGMDDALRVARGARGEEDQGVVFQGERRGALALGLARPPRLGRIDDLGPEIPEHRGESGIHVAERDVRLRIRRPGQRLDLEGRQPRVQRHGASGQVPDRQQVGEELEPASEAEKDAVSPAEAAAR